MIAAAYQAALERCHAAGAIDLIRQQIDECERLGVEFLCCPEGALGGLADYCDDPTRSAVNVSNGGLATLVAPLDSGSVTTIVGFTEIDGNGVLYNAAAVVHRGSVAGVYRKLHPVINRSVYSAGSATPVFTIGALTLGIIICRDSTFPEPARRMVEQGASVVFIPTNNGLPRGRASASVTEDARHCDVAIAVTHRIPVIRADVAGEWNGRVAHGSSEIVDAGGMVLAAGQPSRPGLLVASIC